MNTVVKAIDCKPFFVREVGTFIKRYVYSPIKECRSTHIYSEKKDVTRKRVVPPPSTSSSGAARQSEICHKRESWNHRGSRKQEGSSRRFRSSKIWKSSNRSSSRLRSLRRNSKKFHKRNGTRSCFSTGRSRSPKRSSRRRDTKGRNPSPEIIRLATMR